MTDEILRKLGKYTETHLKEEAGVVYVLVQIGKIIERDKLGVDYPTICLYRDWVVHSQLTYDRADGRRLLQSKLNTAIKAAQEDNEGVTIHLFADAFSPQSLSTELFTFCKKFSLSINEPSGDWFKSFYKLLLRIIIDLPLKATDPTHVFEEIRFTNKMLSESGAVQIQIKLRPGEKHINLEPILLMKEQIHYVTLKYD